MQGLTACAVRVERGVGFAQRYDHFATTSRTVYGKYRPPEEAGE